MQALPESYYIDLSAILHHGKTLAQYLAEIELSKIVRFNKHIRNLFY